MGGGSFAAQWPLNSEGRGTSQAALVLAIKYTSVTGTHEQATLSRSRWMFSPDSIQSAQSTHRPFSPDHPPSWASETVSSDHCAVLSPFLGNKTSRLHFSVLSFSPPQLLNPLSPFPFLPPPKSPLFLVSSWIHWERAMARSYNSYGGGMHNFQTFHKTEMVALCISPRCHCAESHLFLYLNPILRASFCYLSLGICQGQEGGWGWGGCEFSLSQAHPGQSYI